MNISNFAYPPRPLQTNDVLHTAASNPIGGFLSSTQIVRPLIFVPTITIGAPSQIDALLIADFLQRPGSYVFFKRPSNLGERPTVRIGEGLNVARRLDGKRDSWLDTYDLAILVTCEHGQFDKTCAEVLEHRLTAIIEGRRSATVDRDAAPKLRRLDSARDAAMDFLIGVVRQELAQRGIDLLTKDADAVQGSFEASPHFPKRTRSGVEPAPTFGASSQREYCPRDDDQVDAGLGCAAGEQFTLHYDGLAGRLRRTDEGFLIEQGTEVSPSEASSLALSARKQRAELVQSGIITPVTDSDHWRLARSYVARSLTEAAHIVTGSTKSARRVWRPSENSTTIIRH